MLRKQCFSLLFQHQQFTASPMHASITPPNTPSPTVTPSHRPAHLQHEKGCGTCIDVCGHANATTCDHGHRLKTFVPGAETESDVVELPFAFNWFGDTIVRNVTVSVFGNIVIPGEGEISVFGWTLIDGILYRGGKVCCLDTDSSVTISWEGVAMGGYATVSGQAELFPNGNVHLRWGRLEGGENPDRNSFPAGLTRRGKTFPCTGVPFDENGVTSFYYDYDGASFQCRLFDTGYRTYSASSKSCGSFRSIGRLNGTIELLDDVVTPANAHPCSTLTLHVHCLLRHVSACVCMAHSNTSAHHTQRRIRIRPAVR